jgi:hypothetical protein
MFYFVDFEQVMNENRVFSKTRRKDRIFFDLHKLLAEKFQASTAGKTEAWCVRT